MVTIARGNSSGFEMLNKFLIVKLWNYLEGVEIRFVGPSAKWIGKRCPANITKIIVITGYLAEGELMPLLCQVQFIKVFFLGK